MSARRAGRLVAAAFLVGVGLEVAVSGPPAGLAAQPEELSAGGALYARDCLSCHGVGGEGTADGPSLIGVGAASADFMLSTGRMPIDEPVVQPKRRPPAYGPEQIDALVAYVASFGPGPAIPQVSSRYADLADGARTYLQSCASCHGATGVGGALAQGLEAPPLDDVTPTQVAEAVRLGGAGLRTGNMPAYPEEVLDDQQLADLIAYVDHLQRAPDPGGASLTHLGPVAEGFVAVFGGLAAAVLIIRWLGRSTREEREAEARR